ncbi:MAG: SMC family ATPase [Arachnia sp.]
MRIHRLRIEAIGPFPGSHDVDFDQLSAGGLFLLEGPTGAGKSTLIDAITYGLYGTLGKALDARLPSAHAPLAEPVIEVVFSTSAGIHKARRTPPYDRPKKRGGGVTPQNASARLWRLATVDDPIGEPLASGAQEVGAEIQRLLHLSRDQFMQTVVLPQGRFSTFLRAKPDERAEVLRDVFGTGIYQQVQDQLQDMARVARRTVTAAQGEVAAAVRAFVVLLDDEDPVGPALAEAGATLDADTLTSLADRAVAARRVELQEAVEALGTATTAEHAARTLLDSQKDLERNLGRRASLLAEQSALTEVGEAVAEDRERLALAQRAATVSGSLRAHGSASGRMDGARYAVSTACAALQDTPDHDLADLEDLSSLRGVIDDVSGERGGLADLARLEAGLAGRCRRLTDADEALAESLAVLENLRNRMAERPGQREQLTMALDDLRRSAMPVPVAEQVMQQRRAVRDAAHLAQVWASELAGAERELTAAGVRAAAASEREGAVRLRWINSMAGTLASGLVAGDPCPVCGGTEHPSPAPELPDHASLEDVDAATGACQEAVSVLQDARAAHIRLVEKVAAQQEAAGHARLVDAREALAAAEVDVAAARDAVRLIEAAERGITAFDTATDEARVRIGAAETAAATTGERLRGERDHLAEGEERCRLGAGGSVSVGARVEKLEARLERARTLADARQEHGEAGLRFTDATATLEEALREAEFADADVARAAHLDPADSTLLQRRVQRHDTDLARVASGLAEGAVAALTGRELVDVPSAREEHDRQRASLMEASATRATAAGAMDRCERARLDLGRVLDEHRTLTEDAAPVVRMGELATAGEGNAKSTTLSTFVLLRRFEDVVAAANDRLTVMSEGRFSLLRIDEREGRARRAGLGLSVRDHHTESNRDPHTLSGGETFYVSLCLALGLADVVTSEAGGISLDTLFIDEGFGSLDPDTLDGVLGELARLQDGGRAVGIVSHVAELKARIPERVEITRLPEGGSTLLVRA